MENYGIGQGQHQYRLKLKNRLIKTFIDKILFLTPESNTQKVIVSRNPLTGQAVSSTIKTSLENIFKKAALLIRQSATELIENSSEVSWPPTFEELTHESRNAPEIMQKFYNCLLTVDLHHETSKKINR